MEPTKLDDIFFTDILGSIASESEEGKYLVFDFVNENWEALITRYSLLTIYVLRVSFKNVDDQSGMV